MNLLEAIQLSRAENQGAGYDALPIKDQAQVDLAAARLELALDIRRGEALEVLLKIGTVLTEGIPADRPQVVQEHPSESTVQLVRHTSEIAGVFRGSIAPAGALRARECP